MKLVVIFMVAALLSYAETGRDAWLRYAPSQISRLPATVVALGDSQVELSAQYEIVRGIQGLSGRTTAHRSSL